MSKYWRYDLRCEKCGWIETYAALPKDKYEWTKFYQNLFLKDWNGNYQYCEQCDLWTKQILLSFDKQE